MSVTQRLGDNTTTTSAVPSKGLYYPTSAAPAFFQDADSIAISGLWCPPWARMHTDHASGDRCYTCSCDKCKAQSASGNGNIAFESAEDLIDHLDISAFLCPMGCDMHVPMLATVILRHIEKKHGEIFPEITAKEGRIWCDYAKNTYTRSKENPFRFKAPAKVSAKAPMPVPIQVNTKPVFTPAPKGLVAPPSLWKTIPRPAAIPIDTTTPTPEPAFIPRPQFNGWAAPVRQPPTQATLPILPALFTGELAPFDLQLEKDCDLGQDCPHRTNPQECALNHFGLGPMIPRGFPISAYMCKFDRPPKSRCFNVKCCSAHLQGRVAFIEKKKVMIPPPPAYRAPTHIAESAIDWDSHPREEACGEDEFSGRTAHADGIVDDDATCFDDDAVFAAHAIHSA